MNVKKAFSLMIYMYQSQPIKICFSEPKYLRGFLDSMVEAKKSKKNCVVEFKEEFGIKNVTHSGKLVDMKFVIGWDAQEIWIPDMSDEDRSKLYYSSALGGDSWKV